MKRVTATEASRRFSDLLNRAKYGGESFLVERNGEPVAEIRPVRKRASTVKDAVKFLKDTPLPDPEFERDMREIMAQSKTMYPRDPWAE